MKDNILFLLRRRYLSIERTHFFFRKAARLGQAFVKIMRCIFIGMCTVSDESDLIEIKVKKLSYLWREDLQAFSKVAGIDKGLQKSDFHSYTGYSAESQLMKYVEAINFVG